MILVVEGWAQELMACFLAERGCGGVEIVGEAELVRLVAYCSSADAARELWSASNAYGSVLEEIHGVRPLRSVELEMVVDPGWAHAWRAHFKAARVSRRVAVRPPWEAYQGPVGVNVVQVNPGQAFGTGLHESTRLCIRWLDSILVRDGVPDVALDVGTGTGILAMVMALLGVGHVLALDIDPLAVEAARENVELNGLVGRVEVLEGSLEAVGERLFPLVAANLTGVALRESAGELASKLSNPGRLVASGILLEERPSVERSFLEVGMALRGRRTMGEWCALVLSKGP